MVCVCGCVCLCPGLESGAVVKRYWEQAIFKDLRAEPEDHYCAVCVRISLCVCLCVSLWEAGTAPEAIRSLTFPAVRD